jgi:hypothetical protein
MQKRKALFKEAVENCRDAKISDVFDHVKVMSGQMNEMQMNLLSRSDGTVLYDQIKKDTTTLIQDGFNAILRQLQDNMSDRQRVKSISDVRPRALIEQAPPSKLNHKHDTPVL